MFFSLFFFGFGFYAAWVALTLNLSNQHLRVGPNEVYSEWGTASAPQSSLIDFRQLDCVALRHKLNGKDDRRFLVGTTKNGDRIELPVGDLLQFALKRVFLNATRHDVNLDFPPLD